MEARGVQAAGDQVRLPEQRHVVQDRVVLGERHVVGQPRSGQVDRHVMRQALVRVNDPVVQVRCARSVVEKKELAGAAVHLGVGRDPQLGREGTAPAAFSQVVQGQRVEQVQVTALVEAGHGDAGVHHHVGGGRVLHPAAGAPARPLGQFRVLGDPGPQRAARLLLGGQAVGADEPVPVGHLPVPERDLVDHAVAVERVVPGDGGVQRVLGVAQVNAVQVGGQLAGDLQVIGVVLDVLRPPGPGPVGVIVVVWQGGQQLGVDLDVGHGEPSPLLGAS